MYTHILHPTDLFENHFDMCKQALEIANHFKAKLYLLHVIEAPVSLQIAQSLGFAEVTAPTTDNAKMVMETLGDALNIPLEQQFIEIGSINAHVLQKTQALNCSLIIVGSHMQTKMPLFLESSAHEIIHNAPCDVLILRA